MKPTVYFFTNIAPHYRRLLWETFLVSKKIDFEIFYGQNKDIGISEIDVNKKPLATFSKHLHKLENYWIKGKYLFWQKGLIKRCLFEKPEMVILLGEFNVLSNWFAILICKIRNIRVGLLGHGMYGDEKLFKLWIRLTYYRLADAHFIYEKRSKNIMISHGIDSNDIYLIFNSLDYHLHKTLRAKYQNLNKNEVFSFFKNPDLPTFIFVGRLTTSKKLMMLLKAVALLNQEKPTINLFIIGDGPEQLTLKTYADTLSENTVHFYGACYDEHVIGKYLATSDLCVSPGNVGLTAIHSLSYGTPVCTHDNFANQGPEVEAIEKGSTGVFFEEDDLNDLYLKLKDWLHSPKPPRQKTRQLCYQIIDSYYNPIYQLTVFEQAVQKGKPFI